MKLEKQNILFIVRTMGLGGTENVVIQLCEILSKKVNKIVVCSSGGVHEEKLQEMGIKHYMIPDIASKNPMDMLKSCRSIKSIIDKEQITIVHSHHRMAAFYAELVAPKSVVKVANAHNTFTDKKKLTQLAYRNTKVIAVGEMVKKNLTEYFEIPKEQVCVIHNAVKPFDGKIVPIEMLYKEHAKGNVLIGNIGRLDPELKTQGIKGLTHGAKMEQELWDEFYANPERLVFESERLIAKFSKKNIEEITDIDITNLPEGKERETIIRQRVNQSFFRSVVMSSYNYRCCISGVGNPQLLEACHIVDWTTEVANRTNPKNGLCLNSFFHKAYDQYLLAITPDFKILLAEELIRKTANSLFKTYLERINGNSITLPDKFKPRKDLLELHYKAFLNRKIAK